MCGIAGYKVQFKVDELVLKQMLAALYHRGPDNEGVYKSGEYTAGMRRLSINDLEKGDQPLYNQDRSAVLFYNGEIYNSPDLRNNLESKGYRFRTHSDGEVICHLYDEYGEGLFEKLDGMFAVALWIERERKLILSRDIPGEKPLYYTQVGDRGIVFASEIKSLIMFPGLDLSLNYQGLWDFPTFLWIPQPETVYKSVKALPRSHILTADENGIRLRPYANKFNHEEIDLLDDSVIRETRRVVKEAVESRLLSDVPIGCFLSSGLDSSIVTTLASQKLASLTTFTIGFDDLSDPYHGTSNEAEYAADYAKTLGTKHYTIQVKADDFRNDLMKFCVYADQPFSVTSGLGILAVAKKSHEMGIKVLLSGDGADECFGGYSWYSYLPGNVRKDRVAIKDEEIISFQNFGLDIETRLAVLSGYTPQKRMWAWHYYASESEKTRLYNIDTFDGVESSLRFFNEFNDSPQWSAEDYIKHDRGFYFPNEMLQKLDRMTMAYSVEGRAPFAGPSVLAHADKLRYSHMVSGGSIKWVLRKAFSDILPEDIYLRQKHGFNVPVDHWLKNEWADLLEETFSQNSCLMKEGIINKKSRDVALSMINDKNRLNGHTIFSLIMLNLWFENGKHGYYS